MDMVKQDMDLFTAEKQMTTEMTDQEKLAWLRLIRTENIGPVTFYNLLERFGSAQEALDHLPDLAKKGGRVKNFHPYCATQAQKEIEQIQKLGAQMICASEEHYPLALTATDDAPPVITVLGRSELLNAQQIGMVGARNASLNGRKFAQKLAAELGQAGQVVTSGLARGIDTAAHQGALHTGTIAVIAGGIDIVYPEENKGLYDQISKEGCIVAESPFGQVPFAQSFPRRNRIISGLSAGIVVVEATLRSGSLITARLAGEQGRDVFAVPGFPADPRAQGPNKLIRDGAVLVQNAEDILSHLMTFAGLSKDPQLKESVQSNFSYEEDENLTENAADAILKTLSSLPVQIDDLLRDLHLSPAAGNSALLQLEIAGRVKRSAGGKVSLII